MDIAEILKEPHAVATTNHCRVIRGEPPAEIQRTIDVIQVLKLTREPTTMSDLRRATQIESGHLDRAVRQLCETGGVIREGDIVRLRTL